MHFAALLILSATPALSLALQGDADRSRLRAPLPTHGWVGPVGGDSLVDLDEDGDIDILRLDGQLYLLQNDGRGRFDRVDLFPLPRFHGARVAVGEFDGNAGLDIIYRGFDSLLLLVRQSDGSYLERTGSFPAVPSYGPVSTGDIDGDGDFDLAVSGYQAPDRLFLNDGAGTFVDVPTISYPAGQSVNAKLADFNGDGKLDLLAEDLFLNDGGGVFTVKAGAGVPTSWHHVVDLDGDGDLDLVVEDYAPCFHPNDGTGVFGTPTPLSSYALHPRFLDWDGDGDLDFISAGSYSIFLSRPNPGIFLWRNDGSIPFTFVPQPEANALDSVIGELYPADFDRDGDPDLLALPDIGYGGPRAGILWNEDQVLTSSLPGPESMDEVFGQAQLADLDGDGDLDAIGTELALFENDGLGLFTSHPPLAPNSLHTGLACPDVDADGDLDLIATFEGGSNLRMWRNDGSLGFTETAPPSIGSISIAYAQIRVAELNGLAGDDLVLVIRRGVSNLRETRIFLSDGAGNLVDATSSTPLPPFPRAIALGDLDRDGDVDLLLAHARRLPWSVEVFANSGAGVFQSLGSPLVDSVGNTSLNLNDMDGDGWLDLVSASSASAILHRGQGDGSFATSPAATLPFGPPVVAPRGEWIGLPVTEPGTLPDVFSSQGYLYRNQGGFNFTDESSSLAPILRAGAGVDFGDLDGDGDEDAWFDGPEIHWGLQRQLATRRRPALARPLLLDIHGPPDSVFVLGMSLGRSTMSTPWGLSHLDLSTLVMQGSGTLDSRGRSEAVFEVPARPGLLNLDVYWQAAVGTPARLTNAEVTRLAAP